jgi:hypothetical protein
MGIFLAVIALMISVILIPIGVVYGLIKNLLGINNKSLNIAFLLDIGGNVFCAELFNDLLIKTNQNLFGSPYQTISEVLGINNQLLNMTKTGQRLVNLLHYLDPYHVEKAIGMKVPNIVLTKKQLIIRFTAVLIGLMGILTLIAAITIKIISIF